MLLKVEERPLDKKGKPGQGIGKQVATVRSQKEFKKFMEGKDPKYYFYFFDGVKVSYSKALSYLPKK